MIPFLAKLSKKERLGIYAAMAFVALVFFDRVIFHPVSEMLARQAKEIKESEKKLSYELRNISQKDAVAEEYGKFASYVTKGGSDEEETAALLAEAEEMARSAQLSIVNIKPRPVSDRGIYKEYAIELDLEGPIEPMVTFLYRMNTSKLLLRARQISLGLKEKDSPIVKATMLITKVLLA